MTGSCLSLTDIGMNWRSFFNRLLVDEPVVVKSRVRDATGLTDVADVQLRYGRVQ